MTKDSASRARLLRMRGAAEEELPFEPLVPNYPAYTISEHLAKPTLRE